MDKSQQPPAPAPRVPDQPGLWWRDKDDGNYPIAFVEQSRRGLVYLTPPSGLWHDVKLDGHWLCPCLTPVEQAEKLDKIWQDYRQRELEAAKSGHKQVEAVNFHGKMAVRCCALALGITLPPEGKL